MAPEGSADPGVPRPSLLVFRDRGTRLKKGVAAQWLGIQRKPLKPVAEEKFVLPRTKISSGGFQGRWPGICGGTGSLIVWVGLSFDDKSIKQQWTSKSLSLADQIKFSFLPPPPCFWSLLLLMVFAYLPSRLFSAAPTLLHFVVWTLYSCHTPQSELPSSYPILSVFLQTSHFPTISFPFAIADSHWNILPIQLHASPWTLQSLKLFPRLYSLSVSLARSVTSYLASERLSPNQKCLLQFNRYPLST